MILFTIFLTFVKIGLFTFGGGYAMISIIENICVERKKWITHEEMMDVTVIAESTPGPIAINCATFAVVLPAFLIILMIMGLLKRYLENRYVQAILRGLKPCIIGIILATGSYMILICSIYPVFIDSKDFKSLLLLVILGIFYFGAEKLLKKKISPIMLIMISAGFGVEIYGV